MAPGALSSTTLGGPAVLSRVTLFADVPVADLENLAASLVRRHYGRGESVFRRGDPGQCLYLIESGGVKICLTSPEGREVTLALLGPGDFFGELALLDGLPRSADAVAVEASVLALLDRGAFLGHVESQPRLAANLLSVLSQRLRHDTELVQDAAFLDVPGRLAKAILHLADTLGRNSEGDGMTIDAALTQTDLAGIVGTTRESVNKWLSFYERQGLIRYDRGKITVLEPAGLRQRVY